MRRLSSLLRYAGASTLLATVAACSILGSEEDSSGLDDGTGTGGTAGSGATAGAGAVIGTTGGSSGTGGTDSGGSGEGGGGTGSEMPGECESLQGLGPQCGATSKQATFKTINVLLVLDKSGSMTDQPEGFDTDKWTAMKDALGAALDEEIDINFGMLLYPNDLIRSVDLNNCAADDNCCAVPEGEPAVVVPIREAAISVPAIMADLDDTSPGGGTPTAAALERALLYFTEGEGSSLEGENYVLLATDGGPNCNEEAPECDAASCTTNLDNQCDAENCCDGFPAYCLDDASVTSQIEALAEANVKTFVIGIPGTEAYTQYLNGFADAGGVPQEGADTSYYAVSAESGVQGLVSVFNSITTQLVRSCDIELTEQPPKLDDVNVAIDCDIVERGEDNENWDYDQLPNPTMIQLKGDVCDRLQEEGATRVDVVLGCPVVR